MQTQSYDLTTKVRELFEMHGRIFSDYTEIAGIPVVITDNHNEVFYYWQLFGHATLLHIDAHPDMAGFPHSATCLDSSYYQQLSIGNFICAAVHYGIVDQVYWLNPHSAERRLQDLGYASRHKNVFMRLKAIKFFEEILSIEGIITEPLATRVTADDKYIRWDDLLTGHYYKTVKGEGCVLSGNSILELGDCFILDIDLDAFCCDKHIHYVTERYDGVSGYQDRINETMKLLKMQKMPSIITITRSYGQSDGLRYMPEDKVSEVEAAVLDGLRNIFE